MNLIFALALACLMGCGVYLLLSRNIMRMILGISLLSAATNLLLFVSGRTGRTVPPVIESGIETLGADAANPLPQALILTAIVIGFSLTAFVAALALQTWRSFGTLDGGKVNAAEELGTPFDEESATK
jgi:multicomponent Na+:H+ antiporter subunit C